MFKLAQGYMGQQKQLFNSEMATLGKKMKETTFGKDLQFPTNYNFSQNSVGITRTTSKASIGTPTNPNKLTSGAFTNQTSNTTGFGNNVSDASLPRTSEGGRGKLLTDIGKGATTMGYLAVPYAALGSRYFKMSQAMSSFAANDGDPIATAFGMLRFPKAGNFLNKVTAGSNFPSSFKTTMSGNLRKELPNIRYSSKAPRIDFPDLNRDMPSAKMPLGRKGGLPNRPTVKDEIQPYYQGGSAPAPTTKSVDPSGAMEEGFLNAKRDRLARGVTAHQLNIITQSKFNDRFNK